MDPASIGIALTVANSAMKKISTFYQHGKDLSAMSQEITKWMGAVSDVELLRQPAVRSSLVGAQEHRSLPKAHRHSARQVCAHSQLQFTAPRPRKGATHV